MQTLEITNADPEILHFTQDTKLHFARTDPITILGNEKILLQVTGEARNVELADIEELDLTAHIENLTLRQCTDVYITNSFFSVVDVIAQSELKKGGCFRFRDSVLTNANVRATDSMFANCFVCSINSKAQVILENSIVLELTCQALTLESSIIQECGMCETVQRQQKVLYSPHAPIAGSFHMWKQVVNLENGQIVLAELLVPETAKRTGFTKIRVSAAYVIGFYHLQPLLQDAKLVPVKDLKICGALFNKDFRYRLGELVIPLAPFDESHATCASGIHGFLCPWDAANY